MTETQSVFRYDKELYAQERDAARADAARYQWWRDNACWRPSKVMKLLASLTTPDEINAAIDAARTAEGGL